MLGPTVYTFSIILGVFLTGLGLGSSGGSALAREPFAIRAPVLALCQLLQVLAIAFAALHARRFPALLARQRRFHRQPMARFPQRSGALRHRHPALDHPLGRQFSAGPCQRARRSPRRDPGRLVGEVYGANTIGAIVGSLGFSLIFIPRIGTQHSEQILIALSILAAIAAPEALASKRPGAVAGRRRWSSGAFRRCPGN